jgi:hypothetical protein
VSVYSPAAHFRIEAPDFEHASSLVRALVGVFEAGDVSLDSETADVHLHTRGEPGKAVVKVLNSVEAWLAAGGLDSTMVYLEDRSYRVAAAIASTG